VIITNILIPSFTYSNHYLGPLTAEASTDISSNPTAFANVENTSTPTAHATETGADGEPISLLSSVLSKYVGNDPVTGHSTNRFTSKAAPTTKKYAALIVKYIAVQGFNFIYQLLLTLTFFFKGVLAMVTITMEIKPTGPNGPLYSQQSGSGMFPTVGLTSILANKSGNFMARYLPKLNNEDKRINFNYIWKRLRIADSKAVSEISSVMEASRVLNGKVNQHNFPILLNHTDDDGNLIANILDENSMAYTRFYLNDNIDSDVKFRKEMNSLIETLTMDNEYTNNFNSTEYYKLTPFTEHLDLCWTCFNNDPNKEALLVLIQYFKSREFSEETSPGPSPAKKYKPDA